MDAAASSPPPFSWEAWYEGVGGRSIVIPEITAYFRRIFHEQVPHFEGDEAAEQAPFASPAAAAAAIKATARELGADIVGVTTVEPEDIYR